MGPTIAVTSSPRMCLVKYWSDMLQAWIWNIATAVQIRQFNSTRFRKESGRQARAEVKTLKSVATDRKIIELNNAEYLEKCIDDLESVLRKSDQNNQKELEVYTVEWERKQCRQEGAMNRWMLERKISNQ